MRIPVIILLFILAGCYNQRKAQQDIAKADTSYPEVTSKFCAEKFPVIEKIIKGDSVVLHDTLEVYGEAVSDTTVLHDTVRIIRTLPAKTITITNTVHVTDTIIKENTGAIKACEVIRDQAVTLATDKTKEAAKYRSQARIRLWILIGLLLAVIVYGYFKIKSSIVKK